MVAKALFNEAEEVVGFIVTVNEITYTVDLTGNTLDYSIDTTFERERTLI